MKNINPEKKSPKKSKSLKERVKEHLTNKNDVITEEDLKNIKVGEDSTDNPETAAETTKEAKELEEAIDEKKQTSPWNILSEDDK